MAGGRVGLWLDPHLLSELTAEKTVVLVSGTNGKTTTTALVAAAMTQSIGSVASNTTGSNMPPGHVAALSAEPDASAVVLEVDESYLGQVLPATRASVAELLNLSRDQLDRTNEVRMIAERWRAALATAPTVTVVANADDPLVVFAAGTAAHVVWVSAGLVWSDDATACPTCSGRISFQPDGSWACDRGDLARPEITWWLDGNRARGPEESIALEVQLPGEFNRSNALIALVAAVSAGAEVERAARGIATVTAVAGRFHLIRGARGSTRVMLAKNPAGWTALLDLVAEDDHPVVVGINARTADGLDPSWLFDVPFQRLKGRRVVATGDRWRDLSVRLHYAEVEHLVEPEPIAAIALAHVDASDAADFIGNYTAFQDVMKTQS